MTAPTFQSLSRACNYVFRGIQVATSGSIYGRSKRASRVTRATGAGSEPLRSGSRPLLSVSVPFVPSGVGVSLSAAGLLFLSFPLLSGLPGILSSLPLPPSLHRGRRYVGCATSLPGNRYLAGFTLNGARPYRCSPYTNFLWLRYYRACAFSAVTRLIRIDFPIADSAGFDPLDV